jgi:hypothetical protein
MSNTTLCPECGKEFTKKRSDSKFCSFHCYMRTYNRKRRDIDPTFRQANNRRNKKLRAHRTEQGLCQRCGKPKNTSIVYCEPCRKIVNSFITVEHKRRGVENLLIRRRKRRLLLIEKLGGKCEVCGYRGEALVFHHKTDEKDTISWHKSKNLDTLIDNGGIELLCSNCHIEHHFFTSKNVLKYEHIV